MEYVKNMLIGAVIGIANIIPGVSGGTMMVVLNVFDKLVNAVSNFRKEFKASLKLLSAVALGAGIALLLLSGGISWLLERHYMVTNFFFVGVILGSFPLVWKKAGEDKLRPSSLIAGLVTLILMLLTVYAVPTAADTVITGLTPLLFLRLLVCGVIAAFCMIIPGISGSFVMVLLGVYHTVTAAISSLNIPVLIPLGMGIVIGLLSGAKLISGLLARFPQASYLAILGFMLGSIPAILEKIRAADAFVGGWAVLAAGLALLLGGAAAYLTSSEAVREKLIRRRSGK